MLVRSKIGAVGKIDDGYADALVVDYQRICPIPVFLVTGQSAVSYSVCLDEFPIFLDGAGGTFARFVENVVVGGKEYVKSASGQIDGEGVWCGECRVACEGTATKGEFHVGYCQVRSCYPVLQMLEIGSEVIAMSTSVCVVNLFFMHHHITHDANGYRVRLEHSCRLGQKVRSEIEPYLCTAV